MLNKIEGKFIAILDGLAKSFVLIYKIVYSCFLKPFEAKLVIYQMVSIGFRSLPVAMLTAFSVGMVLALQAGYSGMYVFNEPLYVGTIVCFSIIKELGPVLTATVITGRVGAAITAELGTMKVTEQIDALYTLGTNPVKYLAVPRFLACITMIPILTAISNIFSILGGYVVARYKLDISSTVYWSDTLDYVKLDDFFHGFIKSIFFAGIIAFVSIYKGFGTKGGAEGVGRATTQAVVTTLVLIIVIDYFLSALLVALKIG
ncbi:MAG: ABC transporter permease [Elusimicrobia bacterium]|nr:ABC transporter permease [Elusimicrobiota bacterium]MBU2615027.1 ABC transporter permease [Elusimicrobiota bacterium]